MEITDNSKLPLIMMAGTDFDNREPLLDYAGVDYKAAIDINGKSIITRMIDEFNKSGLISHFFIVGIPEELVELPEGITNVTFVTDLKDPKVPGRLLETSELMLKMAETDDSIFPMGVHKSLFVGADIPFITADIVRKFFERIDPEKNLHISTVRNIHMDKRFPNNKRTFARFREGKYCMGDLSCIDITMVGDRMPQIITFRENRKNFFKVILKLQPMIFFRYIFNRLSFDYTEKTVDKVFQVKSQIIPMEEAEIAFDVDKPEQLEIALKELK